MLTCLTFTVKGPISSACRQAYTSLNVVTDSSLAGNKLEDQFGWTSLKLSGWTVLLFVLNLAFSGVLDELEGNGPVA